MKCEYCGRRNPDNAELCKSCGAPAYNSEYEEETTWYNPSGRVKLRIGLDPNKPPRRIEDYTDSTHTTMSQVVMPDGKKIYIMGS